MPLQDFPPTFPQSPVGPSTSTTFTSGSVVFAGPATLSQDNPNFFYDASGHRFLTAEINVGTSFSEGLRTYLAGSTLNVVEQGSVPGRTLTFGTTNARNVNIQVSGGNTWTFGSLLAGGSDFYPASDAGGNIGIAGTNRVASIFVATGITLSSLTPGQVLFPGTGGLLSGSASLFWDNTNHILNLGATGSVEGAIQLKTLGDPYTVAIFHSVFNSTRDDCFSIGYNIVAGTAGTKIDASEVSIKQTFESNFNADGVNHYTEWNCDYVGIDGTVRRPFYVTVNRSSHAVRWNLLGSEIDFLSDAGQINCSIFDQALLPAANALVRIWQVGGYGSPVAGRYIFGDGSGFKVIWSSRTASVTTDMMTLTEPGNLQVCNNGTAAAQFTLAYTAASVYSDFQVNSSGYLGLSPTGGRVGVNTTAPSRAFHVNGFSARFAGSNNGVEFLSQSGTQWSLSAVGTVTQVLFAGFSAGLITDNIVGINTSAPKRMLDVLHTAGPQIRATYTDNSVFADILVNSSGNLIITPTGQTAFAAAALATNATVGHLTIPSCAGAPTGVPANIPTGQIPMVYDSTNNFLYVYNGGWKKSTVYA